jgi:mRNA-degrading endonuclease RelE of RelBE toxin-antitoxin system
LSPRCSFTSTRNEVLLSGTARKQVKYLPVKRQHRIRLALAELEDDPFRPRPKADIKRLKEPSRSYYRQRIGDLRAIYVVKGRKVLVAKILPQSKAYDWLD